MDYNRMLELCGNYGRYQVLLLLCYAYTNIISPMHYFSQTIISFTPKHWCAHEQLANMSTAEIAAVYANTPNPQCTQLEFVLENATGVVAATNGGACNKWIYALDHNYESITTELNWVCDDAYKAAVGQSLFFLGSCFGTITYGVLADHIGRLPALMLSTLTGALGDFLTAFVHSLELFALSRFLSGLATDTMFYMMYILAFEYLSPQKRTFGLNIITSIFYTFGAAVSPWFAIWVGDWRKYMYIASIPSLGVLAYPFLINESAHWLMTKQKYERAVQCLKRVAKFNGRKVEDHVFEEFVQHYKAKAAEEELSKKKKLEKDTFLKMFRTQRMRKNTIVLILKSIIVTLTFDMVSRNMENFGTSPFYLFAFSSLTYLPGGLTLILLQNIIGRKGMAFSSFMVGALITAVTGYLVTVVNPDQQPWLLSGMIALGRYVVVVAYDAEVQYAAEILPTSVRGQGLSIIHVAGYAFGFLSPYIIYMGTYYKPLPSFINALLLVVGGILCLTLPETLNKTLPESIKDGETFGAGEKWYFFPCTQRKPKTRHSLSSGEPENNNVPVMPNSTNYI